MPDRARAVWKRLLGGVVYLLVVALLMAGTVEIGVRLIRPQVLDCDVPELWKPDEQLGWLHRKNAHVSYGTGERFVAVCTNDIGDRVSCDRPEKKDCAKRILFIGDSFVEALAVPWDQHFSNLMEKDTGACVESTGVGAYEPSQYLAMLRDRLRPGGRHYDLVLVDFYAGNDFVDHAEKVPPPEQLEWKPFQLVPHGLSVDALYDWFYPINQRLEKVSHAYIAARSVIRRLEDPADVGLYGVPDALLKSRLDEHLLGPSAKAIELMNDECKKAGIPMIAMVLPIHNQVIDPDGSSLKKSFPKVAADIDMDLTSTRFVPRLQALPGLTVIDLLPGLRRTPDRTLWGTRDPHFTPRGHAVWYSLARPGVRAALQLPPGQ